MTERKTIGVAGAWLGLLLTVCGLLVLALGLASGRPMRRTGAAGDWVLFVGIWSYIVVTPIAAATALLMGNRHTNLVKANFAVLVVWVLFALWSMSLTF
jgi:drug/metabolite transporter (DMT)-like permease